MREDWRKERDIKFQDRKDIWPTVHPSAQNAFSSFLIIKAVNRLREGGRTCTQTPPAHSSESIQTQRSMLEVLSPVRFLCVNLSADMCYPDLPHVLYMWDSQSSPGPLAALPGAPKSLPQQHDQNDNSLCCVCSAGPALSVSIKLLVPAPLLLFFASV